MPTKRSAPRPVGTAALVAQAALAGPAAKAVTRRRSGWDKSSPATAVTAAMGLWGLVAMAVAAAEQRWVPRPREVQQAAQVAAAAAGLPAGGKRGGGAKAGTAETAETGTPTDPLPPSVALPARAATGQTAEEPEVAVALQQLKEADRR